MKNKNVIKVKNGQQLNQREVKLINDSCFQGLLRFNAECKKNTITLTYNTDGLLSLSEFLKMNPIAKRLFAVILRHIAITVKSIEEIKFTKNLIVWDIDTTYIDPLTWHVYLMYVPLQPYETTGNLKSLLLDIIKICTFPLGEQVDFVQQFVNEVNSGVTYTAYMLDVYCDRISEELLSDGIKRDDLKICSSCNSKIETCEMICPFCGAKIQTQVTNYNTLNSNFEKNSVSVHRAISFNEDENGNLSVFKSAGNKIQSVWLEDCVHLDKISLSKMPFRIGKLTGVSDFCLMSNTVSRKHADIVKENGKYYIIDLGSTNGTYLCGKRLQPGVKEELINGINIRFADAEYKFHID